jgi:hypothetical protein
MGSGEYRTWPTVDYEHTTMSMALGADAPMQKLTLIPLAAGLAFVEKGRDDHSRWL